MTREMWRKGRGRGPQAWRGKPGEGGAGPVGVGHGGKAGLGAVTAALVR